MPFLRAEDTISGAEGVARANIGGAIEELFYIKTFEANVEKKKGGMKSLGNRWEQHKATGLSGKGSMTIHYITSKYRELMSAYAKTGKDVYFTITATNDDPGSSVGAQSVAIYRVNLDSTVIAKFDTEADFLDEELPFTFEGFDILDSFGQPVLG